jgi:hypothetical protein
VASIRVGLHGDLNADSLHPFFFPGMSMVDESSLRWRATAKIELAHAAAAKPLANSGASVWSMRRATLAAW